MNRQSEPAMRGRILVIDDMPDKNGLQVIMELRAHRASTPIIAMSDGGRTKQIEILGDAKLLGAVRIVAKPFTLEEMLTAVQQELDRKRE